MNRKQKIPPAGQIALAVIAVLLVAVVGYVAVVRPKGAQASTLAKRVEAANLQLAQAQAASRAAKHGKPVRVASLFRLVKAMPDSPDMSGILLQLSAVAQGTGITFESLKPGNPTPLGTFTAVPITLNFRGSFYDLSDFLLRLRTLVAVRHGELNATGRLFAVDTLGFGPGKNGFPEIEATLTVDAFVYGSGADLTTPVPSTATTTTGAATATTTTSDPTAGDRTTPPSGATAAGGTP